MKIIVLPLLILAAPALGRTPKKEFKNFYQDISSILEDQENVQIGSCSLEKIRVRVVLEAGVEVPLITNFSLRPEVELYFSRID